MQTSAPASGPREALLISAIIRHPWLLDEFLEDIAGIHFEDADCSLIRDEVLTVHQIEECLDSEKLLEHLSRVGYSAEAARVERAIAHKADAQFAPNASKEQVLEGWLHVMMLHCKAGVPLPLQEAESEHLSDPTYENFRAIVQQVEIASS